jgi:hypothetical protein
MTQERHIDENPKWETMVCDVEIVTRTLAHILSAIVVQDAPRLFNELQHLKVFVEQWQSSLWVVDPPKRRKRVKVIR